MQATICCPDIKDVGVLNPLTEYIKYLPDELLPTFWSEEEQELLTGTTLQPAVRAKLSSLLREFELVRTATENIEWCAKYWWDEDTGMCPCVDMANHASGDATAALYETDEDGDGLLLLRPGKNIGKEDEITITCVASCNHLTLLTLIQVRGRQRGM
jgi:hypothetical protein